jgi:hypothetical protein
MAAKVTFDPVTRIITVTQAPVLVDDEWIIPFDIRADLYSDGKRDWLANEDLRRLIFPIRAVGGDSRPGGALGSTFFLKADWKIALFEATHRFLVAGNFYSEDGKSPFRPPAGPYTVMVEQNLSAIVEVTAGFPAATAAAVWNAPIASHLTPGSAGKTLDDAKKLSDDASTFSLLGL